MLHLYLLRHANSPSNSSGSEDFDRPLDAVGRAEADAVTRYLAVSEAAPGVILCSAAQRTRETLCSAVATFRHDYTVRIERALYLADASAILARVTALPRDSRSCMLIGHNPSCQQLARMLAGEGPVDLMGKLRAGFPTAAVAEITFDETDWTSLAAGAGYLRRFAAPHDLPRPR